MIFSKLFTKHSLQVYANLTVYLSRELPLTHLAPPYSRRTETISHAWATTGTGRREYVTDGDSDPYYSQQGRSARKQRGGGRGEGEGGGGRRRRRPRGGAPDPPPGTALSDLASSSASAADYGVVQSVLPTSSARASTNRESDDILHRADVARHNFRLELMHAGDASGDASGAPFSSSERNVKGSGGVEQEDPSESESVRAARAECLDTLRRLREEAEAKCFFTVASRIDALAEEIAKMRTLMDRDASINDEGDHLRQGDERGALAGREGRINRDDLSVSVPYTGNVSRSRASSRSSRAEPGSPRGRRNSRDSGRDSHHSRSCSPESMQPRLSIVEVGEDDATLHVSPMPKKEPSFSSPSSRALKNGSRISRNLWNEEDVEKVTTTAIKTTVVRDDKTTSAKISTSQGMHLPAIMPRRHRLLRRVPCALRKRCGRISSERRWKTGSRPSA